MKIYVQFSFYNVELKEWITFIDTGSEQIKPGMNEGDATKSAITDGMKKCASRIGVGSDLYKGLITWDKQRQAINIPEHYQHYYLEKGWVTDTSPPSQTQIPNRRTSNKTELTDKLKSKTSALSSQIKSVWQELAGNLDGFDEWYEKKRSERVSDQQLMNLLQKRLREKQVTATA